MAKKIRKHNNFHLQDESTMLRSRLTTEDRPLNVNAESFVQSHVNIGSRTRTQVGKRISNGSMHHTRASHARQTQKNSVEVQSNYQLRGHPGVENEFLNDSLTRNNAMERQSNYQLRGHPGVENEFLNDRLTRNNAMENQSNHRLSEDPRVEEEFINSSFEHEYEEGSVTETGVIKKQTRGPTYMQNIWGRAPHMPLLHVEYNEFGQPIGGENSSLCHFLGSIARNDKYCPVDVKDWHAFPTTKKRDILDVVKLRFHVSSDVAEKWILSSVGNKWKNWKHYLKVKYWCENVAIEHLIEERDERVPVDKWVKLLTFWNIEEAKKISQRNENARSKKIMNHRTGKRSFALKKAKMTKEKGRSPTRVELFNSCFVPSNGTPNEVISSKYWAMLERSNQLSEGFNDVIGPDDVFAQVMGKDASGHVRMMGQGVCPRDVWSETPISKSNRLLMEQQATIAHLENRLSMQQKSSQHNKGQFTITSLSPNVSSTLPIEVGNYVSLRSLFDKKKVVAEGYVHNTEPTTKVGGQLLGMNWCEVNVKVAVEPEEQLIRPYGNVQKISQTIGSMVAWPCSLVTPTEDM